MNPTAQLLEPEIRELIRDGLYSELREALHLLPPADVADILAELPSDQAAVAFRFMPRDDAASAFAYLTSERQEDLINALGAEASVRMVEAMGADDRARLLDELPEEVAQRLIGSLSPESRRETQAILGYPPRSVGRLMTPDYVRLRPEWTIAQALEHIRRHGRDAETVNVVYVIDEQGRLIDDLRLRQMLFADPDDTVESILNRQFISLRADEDQEHAVQTLQRYDRSALPVVDSRGVLLGIVTHDDLADVAQAMATEDMQKLGGMEALESSYADTGQVEMFRKRGFWLSALLVGQTITIIVLGSFQDRLDRAIELTLFLPLVISCGGNSGSQAATLITRALALGEVRLADWARIVRRELLTGVFLGLTLATLGFLCVGFFTSIGHAKTQFPFALGLTVALSVVTVVVWGTTLGSLLPLVLKRFSIDPATASSPMVATLMDASGTLIYLAVAIAVLTGRLL
ncbi:MAG: magnesium transporter [Phycisphaeraceae bacterium]|nr:MAG: magnesium transporter [Phycisphaeraceae bacterium]